MVRSLSDESQHDGIGGMFWDDDGIVQSPQQLYREGEQDAQKQPSDVNTEGIFEFIYSHDQNIGPRLLDPVTDVPTVSAIPTLDRTEETMSFSTRSMHGAAEAVSSSAAEIMGQTHLVLEIAHRFHHGISNAVSESSSDISGETSSTSPYSCLSPSNTANTSPSLDGYEADGSVSSMDDYHEEASPYLRSQDSQADSPIYDSDQQTDYADQDSPPYDGGDDNDKSSQHHTAPEEDHTSSTINTGHGTAESTGMLQQKDQPNKRAAEDDGNDHHSPAKSKRLKKQQESHLRLACPYYKYDPVRYRQCHAKVLKRNSYVKQHLFRSHMQPIYCFRCMSTWPSDEELGKHLRTQRCEVREKMAPEGITTEQKRKLQSRLGGQNKSESDQWFELYAILFPGAQKPKSAYLDGELSEDVESLREFIERRGTDIMMDRLVGSSVLQRDGVGNHELHAQVQNALTSMFDGWHNQRKEMGGDTNDRRSKRLKPTPGEFSIFHGEGRARTDTASTSTTVTIGLDEHTGDAETSPATSAT
ncbi:hypothetical protein FHETE_7739 [Fusarium heterosporum]|uniref:C2H2-type domain-containing protein n=1 Tax=Fusarium heterosporum TaxID=42747 RepID=A0A8H5SZH5_FUSHE|nr:hypothetical protein FHETE_7739 [Fusarium heterosporum]